MMTPSQLKEYEFKTAGRNAYKMDDVDNFFAEVAASYTKMFHENGELVKRVGLLADRLEKFKKQEEEIKSAVLSAQRAADIIVCDAKNSVADAEAEAEAVLKAAKSEAELIKSDAEKQAVADSELLLAMARDKAQEIIKKAKEEAQDILIKANTSAKDKMGAATRTMTSESLLYDMLKKEVSEFKSNILNQYKTHIELISKLPDLAEEEAQKQVVESSDNVVAAETDDEIKFDDGFSISEYEKEYNVNVNSANDVEYFAETDEDDINFVNMSIESSDDFTDFAVKKEEKVIDDADDSSTNSSENVFQDGFDDTSERQEALQYFSNENKDDLMEVDEEMLTQDGELVVKTDLPQSFFDNADNLEFINDEETDDEDDSFEKFSFSDIKKNANAKIRPSERAAVDTSYLDFLASEADAEKSEKGRAIIEGEYDTADSADSLTQTQRKGFFRRK